MHRNLKHLTMLAVMLLTALQTSAQWTRRTNLPTVYVNTFNNANITSKDVYIYSTLRYVDENDSVAVYDSTQIRGRGNSTWRLSKKPYKIKFNQKEKFLGKGYAKAKKWTLLANAGDKTMIRNAVTSAMGEVTHLKFNPAYKFVDMVLNNQYLGTYQISDQVDVRPHRVDIVEQDLPLTGESDISGGYLLEVDGFEDGNCFKTSIYLVPIRIHYPDDEDIVASQNSYIRNYIKQFETTLANKNFDDPEAGYRSMVDTTSLIDWYLCTEISANIDGFYSTYFYKDQQDPLLYWGPLWDYDIAYNNDYRMRSEQGLSTTARSLMVDIGYGATKFWMNRMWQDDWFCKKVNDRYNELLDNGLVDHLNGVIDSLVTLLDASQQLNYRKWGINTSMYHEVVLYSSYNQYISDLRSFISDHTAWLKEEFNSRKPLEPTPRFQPTTVYYRIVNVNTRKDMEMTSDGKVQQAPASNSRESSQWQITKNDDDSYSIVNRSTGLALNDPTQGTVGPTTNVGTQLNGATPEDGEPSQQWDLLPQGTDGYYNLLNLHTSHIANLQGGSANDGTPILSYTNDDRNATSNNRLWLIVSTGIPVPEAPTSIATPEPDGYALAFNNVTHELHFGTDDRSALTFTARLYAADGRAVGSFRADERFSVASLPAGVYIVSWNVGGKQRSAKFSKR